MFYTKMELKQIAIISRLLILLLQLIANHLIPDHSANVFKSPESVNSTKSGDWLVDFAIGGFRRWDAEHYLHISEYGYTYEHQLAFYPLYPFAIRYLTKFIAISTGIEQILSFRRIALIVAIVLNLILFVKAVEMLDNLTKLLFAKKHSSKFTNLVILLFCFNPASVFFSAPYTECLFALLSFWTMYKCARFQFIAAMIPLCLSIVCRSNGMINIGFVVYYSFKCYFSSVQKFNLLNFLKFLCKTVTLLVMPFIAFLSVQLFFHQIFCFVYDFPYESHLIEYAHEANLILAGNYSIINTKWCHNTIPISYGYIQAKYWNVGLLHYYELKQLPNFLLALPVLILFLRNLFIYFEFQLTKVRMFGFVRWFQMLLRSPSDSFAFMAHATFLTISCILYVHIQVSTRLLACASPCFYWFSATQIESHSITVNEPLSFFRQSIQKRCLISIWFLSYFFIGTTMFCNFLPWT